VRQVVESPCDIHGYHPLRPTRGAGQKGDLADGIVATATWTEPLATALKPRFPEGFEGVLALGLAAAVENTRTAKGPEAVMGFGHVHPSDWPSTPGWACGEVIHQLPACLGGLHHQFINSRRILPGVELRDPPNTQQRVRVAAQHELLQRAGALRVARL